MNTCDADTTGATSACNTHGDPRVTVAASAHDTHGNAHATKSVSNLASMDSIFRFRGSAEQLLVSSQLKRRFENEIKIHPLARGLWELPEKNPFGKSWISIKLDEMIICLDRAQQHKSILLF